MGSENAFGNLTSFQRGLRELWTGNNERRKIDRITSETHLDLLPATAVAAGSEKQLLLSGTGTEVTTRAPRGGARITTQASSPADNDQVQLAGVADTAFGLATAAANGMFRIDALGNIIARWVVSLPNIASLFARVGLDENITDVDPSGTAGEGVSFLFCPTGAATELAVDPGLTTAQYANWILHSKVNGVDQFVATNVPVVADRNYDLRVEIDPTTRKPLFFIDNALVVPSSVWTTGLTVDDQMAMMLGVEVTASAAAQKSMDIRYVGASRLFSTS